MGRVKKHFDGVPDGYILAAYFAKQIGVSRNAVVKAVNEGRIVSAMQIEGHLFVHADDAQKELAKNNGHVGGAQVKTQAAARDIGGEISDSISMIAARRKKLEVETALKRVELAKATGLLIDKKDAEARLFEIGSKFRSHMQQIPQKAVDDVMAAKTRNAVILVLESVINEALTALADDLEKGI